MDEKFITTARRISESVNPEFQEQVFDRQIRAEMAKPLAALRAMVVTRAMGSGEDPQAASDSVVLDRSTIPTFKC